MTTPAWDRPEVEAVVSDSGGVWVRQGRRWVVGAGDPTPWGANVVERHCGPCVPLVRERPTITQAEYAGSLARVADAAYAEGVRRGKEISYRTGYVAAMCDVMNDKADPTYSQGYQDGWTEAWATGAQLDEAEYRRGYDDAKAAAFTDGFADGFRAGRRSAEATRATVSPAAPDLDPSAPPATRGPQRKPWLTGAQADAAIRERRGLSGACDRLMRGFAEGDR